MLLEENKRKILLNNGTSKCNKMHLVAGWIDRGYEFEYKWDKFNENIKFKFDKDSKWIESSCFDDVYQAMQGDD